MLIRVADIPEEGLQIEGVEAFPHPFRDSTWKLEELSLLADREEDILLVRGRLTATIPQLCGRCLEPYSLTIRSEVDAKFVPRPAGRGEEHELGGDDLESDVYDNGVVDLDALIETETSLEVPMKPLCRPDCRGLCPVCGGNRNVTACSCEEQATDPRWAPLKAWAARQPR
jgi:uncharacterized protein